MLLLTPAHMHPRMKATEKLVIYWELKDCTGLANVSKKKVAIVEDMALRQNKVQFLEATCQSSLLGTAVVQMSHGAGIKSPD